MKTKFFTLNQNNSGGYFIVDDKAGVARFLIIEAKDAAQALRVMDGISYDCPRFHEFCNCCGERWSSWLDYEDGTERPEIYGKRAQEYLNYAGDTYLGEENTAFIHYLDGRKEKILAVTQKT